MKTVDSMGNILDKLTKKQKIKIQIHKFRNKGGERNNR